MKKITIFKLIIIMIFAVLFPIKATAKNILVNNTTEIAIESMHCLAEHSTNYDSLVLKNLAANSSIKVKDTHFPDQMCARLVLNMKNGETWQFYVEYEVGALNNFDLALNPINIYSEKNTIPHMSYEADEKYYQHAAGIPFSILWQLINDSSNTNMWNAWINPNEKFGVSSKYFLSFGNLSWDLDVSKLKIQNNIPTTLSFYTNISTSSIQNIIDDFLNNAFILKSYTLDGKEVLVKNSDKNQIQDIITKISVKNNDYLTFQKDTLELKFGFTANDMMLITITK